MRSKAFQKKNYKAEHPNISSIMTTQVVGKALACHHYLPNLHTTESKNTHSMTKRHTNNPKRLPQMTKMLTMALR